MRPRFFLALAFSFLLAVSYGDPVAQAAVAPPADNPEGDTGALKTQVTTGGSYDAESGNATRIVNDLKVPDALGVYGLDFTRYWNSLHPEDTNFDAEWPRDFGDSGWSHSWKWTAVYGDEFPDFEQHPAPPHTYITSITITFPDGHATKFKIARTDQVIAGGVVDPRCGPPYYANHGERDWPSLGPTVHDKLVEMTETGSEFWLSRADGGAVHFVGLTPPDTHLGYAVWAYEAREVIDPHGLHTQLHYTGGYLDQVTQDGGRSLVINWGEVVVGGVGAPVIASVDSKGKNGEQLQHVSYWYAKCGGVYGHSVLSKVIYEDEAPGQTAAALYTYSMYYGDGGNNGQPNSFPLLKTANDPHYAGAMTKIGYKFYGNICPAPTPPVPNPSPNAYSNWFHWKRECVTEERNPETSKVVARFDALCLTAFRKDYNGLGGWRLLAFGSVADDPHPTDPIGFQLTRLYDFVPADTYPPPESWPFRKQNGTEPSKAWDGRGILTQMVWDASGSPSQIHHPFPADGGTRSYDRVHPEYSGSVDPPGSDCIHNLQHRWLFKKTDELGNYTLYRRDARRRITDIFYYKFPNTLMASEGYTYNDFTNQITSHTLPSGATVTYQYDSLDHLVLEWNSEDGSGDYTRYDYDSLGRVDWVQGPLARTYGRITQMEYNGRHQVTKVKYPAPESGTAPFVTYEYDSYGNCTGIVDELGHRKDYTYDSYRRCTSYTEQVNACGVASRTWNWFYDRVLDNGAKFSASTHTSKKWRLQYEPAFNDNGEIRLTSRTFDLNDRITSEQTGFASDMETHKFAYDANGQKSKDTDPLLRETTYTYDFRNRLETTTEPARIGQTPNPVTRFDYDQAGNKTKVTFPDHQTQQWDNYDPFGQAWKFTDELSNVTDLVYSCGPMKKLKQVITHRDPNGGEVQPTTFNYDTLGRLYQTMFPDGSDEFSIYQFGQLSYWKTRRNQGKHIHYDARGREDSHTWENGTAPGINRVWDAANRLTSIANAFSTINYTYDDASQMATESSNVAGSGATRQLTYCRFPSGEVAHLTYPGGSFTVNRGYTARGQLAGVGWPGGSTSYVYLADGKVDYQPRSNGVTTSYGYDGRGIVSSVSDKNLGGDSLAHREYWRDDRDRILAWKRGTDTAWNQMENGTGDRYGYDAEGQLTDASYRLPSPEASPGTALRTETFHYDAMGNRIGYNYVATRGVVTFNRRNNGLNQYLDWTPSAIYHDDNFPPPSPPPSPPWQWVFPGNGVTMADGYITASFNALNQPVAMWSSAYGPTTYLWFGYDPLGRCVKRWRGDGNGAPVGPPATYYYYDGWNLVQEGSGGTSVDRTYVQGARVDEIVASQVGGLWYFHHYDGQGNCIMLTAGITGAIQEQYDYDAFGFPYFYNASGGTLPSASRTRFLFTGREWLSDLRIYDYRARQYQPELGRFLQPDPKEFGADDYNLYRYCRNDPVNKSDPTGLETLTRPEMDGEIGDRVVQAAQFIGDQIAQIYREEGLIGIIGMFSGGRMHVPGGLHIPGRLKLAPGKISAPPKAPGRAPVGNDGHPVEIHHEGGNAEGPLREMTRTDHRLGENYQRNHPDTNKPSEIDRKTFDQQRKEYWKEELNKGRFPDK